jgi:hypothetical protein
MFRSMLSILVALVAVSSFAADSANTPSPSAFPVKDTRFFELRTYHAAPGKLDALQARFRDHTNKLFAKHGIEILGFWVPENKEGQTENSLVCILAFPSHDARDRIWKEFATDVEWLAVKPDSEKNGKLIEKVDMVYMTAADFSPAPIPLPRAP